MALEMAADHIRIARIQLDRPGGRPVPVSGPQREASVTEEIEHQPTPATPRSLGNGSPWVHDWSVMFDAEFLFFSQTSDR
ncbi:hypothetical protein [Nocardia australiensis]|uniref:hypothetical protein n=1 Tax=Nocardia australiensis TaxID=2887191 RepID=UPI001D15C2BD|nr:hypothetical protein [Nocardia australiensis]